MTVKEITDTALSIMGYTGQNGNERFTRRIMNKVIPIFNVVYQDIWNIEMTPQNLMQWYRLHDVEKYKELRTLLPRDRILYLQEQCQFVPAEGFSDNITFKSTLEDRAIEAMKYGVAAFLAQSEDDGDNQALWMSMYNKKRAGLTHVNKVLDVAPKVLERYEDENLPYPTY